MVSPTDTAPIILTDATPQQLSTAGMTTKVVKGSLWTLGGQVLPMMVAFVSTPFVIRFLGSEAYGVLLLVGLIPTYFSFADFGMGVASTKFAAEAFGQGNQEKERQIVWTATTIAAVAALIIALPIFLFSYRIVAALNVPEHLLAEASIALKITSVAFVFGILASVLNSPMLARLRMDLNTVTGAVPKMLLATVTPFILYYGGGIVGAVWWAFIVGVATFAVVFYFSGRLVPDLVKPSFNREFLRPLLNFGGAWVIAMIAVTLLVNVEKLLLARLVSVQALAYYSVAFTLANLAIMFALALLQSLIPAFSQLQSPDKKEQFDDLFARANRLVVLGMLPALAFMTVIGRPFLSLWAGEEFGTESTASFYVLMVGIALVLLASVANCAILSAGKTNVLAKIYWIELVVYTISAAGLIYIFGVLGAALAWSVRSLFDFVFITRASKRFAEVNFSFFRHVRTALLGAIILLPQVVFAILIDNYSPWLVVIVAVSNAAYCFFAWHALVDRSEREWIWARVGRVIGHLE